MKKWYKSGPVKGILLVIQNLLVVLVVVSIAWVFSYPGLSGDIISGKQQKSYADTNGFGRQFISDSAVILAAVDSKQELEADGKIDMDKIVDLKTYAEEGKISGKNESGLAYKLGDLYNWYDDEENDGTTEPVLVCKTSEGRYEYYTAREFTELLEAGELAIEIEKDDWGLTEKDIIDYIENGTLLEYELSDIGALVKKDGTKYSACWSYDGYDRGLRRELYAPIGADSILDIVNEEPEWNGELSRAQEYLENAVYNISEQVGKYNSMKESWDEGNTNLTYLYADMEKKKIYTNRSEYADFKKLDESLEKMTEEGKYVIVQPKLVNFKSNVKEAEGQEWKHLVQETMGGDSGYVYAANVNTTYPVQDTYYGRNARYEKYAPHIRNMLAMGVLAALGVIGIVIWLTVVAGKNNKDDKVHLSPFDCIKTEIAAALVAGIWGLGTYMLIRSAEPLGNVNSGHYYANIGYYYANTGTEVIDPVTAGIMAAIAVFGCIMFMIGYLSLVRRIKAKTIWKNSLLRWLIRFVVQIVEHFHEIGKTVVIFGAFVFLHWFAMLFSVIRMSHADGLIFMIVVDVIAAVYLVRWAIGQHRIRAGIERIAKGELNYQIPMQNLTSSQKNIAGKVNGIGAGLDAAVEASMKNERLKTDLITNVSHDIKTPLTSIINYVELLKRENFKDPKIRGYLDVLEAKAYRLKTLTEDVVEASKVSSGNITLEFMNINLVEMIQQTSGEFEEKFAKRNLTEVLSLPGGEAVIRVDGRRMWRVLENIYNNVAKYAMEGTRVYADLTTTPTEVIFSLKNISEEPLNINADELTERFVRGEVSRSTEGSGLGLSIAKSLTDMQGGKFELYLDGDLFRVTITFPRMVKPAQASRQEESAEQEEI